MTKVIHRFKDVSIGDVVTLASGGPPMTVTGFGPPEPRGDFAPAGALTAEDTPLLNVAWFADNGVFGQGRFPLDALVVKDEKNADRNRPVDKDPLA